MIDSRYTQKKVDRSKSKSKIGSFKKIEQNSKYFGQTIKSKKRFDSLADEKRSNIRDSTTGMREVKK